MLTRDWPATGETLHAFDEGGAAAMPAARYVELTQQHHDLDYMIGALSERPTHDEVLVARLKKRKLRLKDAIARATSELDTTGDAAAYP
jgi:hypothetical protein